MSIINTSLLDATNYEKHQKILLEFLHEMYLMTNTKQTSHISVVHSKLRVSWDKGDVEKSKLLWERVNEVFKDNNDGKSMDSDTDLVQLIKWAFFMRKFMAEVANHTDVKFSDFDINFWTNEWEDQDDDY